MNDPRGSAWRLWDLHFHTPSSSGDYEDGAVTNKDIIEALVSADVCLVGVTDHNLLDPRRIEELRNLAGDRLTVLPGLEVTSELGGRESVHITALFPEDSDVNDLSTQFQVRLKLPAPAAAARDHGTCWVSFSQATEIACELGGVVLVHAGRRANSIENISNAEVFKRNLKRKLAERVNALEVSRAEDVEAYHARVFPTIGRVLPIVAGSDNHNARAYKLGCPCWVKADPTFRGLKQAMIEPQQRIWLGSRPPRLDAVRQNATKYMDTLWIQRNPHSPMPEVWFDGVEIPLNSDLIAVIGNKGAGKSALTDILGLLGESRNSDAFSFLNPSKFCEPKGNKARHFKASLSWRSGVRVGKDLDEHVDRTKVELVKYIPQDYLERLCNQIGSEERTGFDDELEKIIFSHVEPEHRLEQGSLRDLLQLKTEELLQAATILRSDIHRTNEEIIELEKTDTIEYRVLLDNTLRAKQEELALHDAAKPAELQRPDTDVVTNAEVSAQLESAIAELKANNDAIAARKKRKASVARMITSVHKVEASLDNLRLTLENVRRESVAELALLGLQFDDIVKFKVNTVPLENRMKDLCSEEVQIATSLDTSISSSLTAVSASLQTKISALQKRLDEPSIKYHEYQQALRGWEDRRSQILGSGDTPGSLRYYEEQLRRLDEVPSWLTALREERAMKAQAVHECLLKLRDVYRDLYQPVQSFVETHTVVAKDFKMNFAVSITDIGFAQGLFNRINRAVTGYFSGVPESEKRLQEMMVRCDFNSPEDTVLFLGEVLDRLGNDPVSKKYLGPRVEGQLRKGYTLCDFYDYLFSLDYLLPKYILKLGDRLPRELSPGEKGALLLVFYLLIDKADVPLIIDQPEENLDNQTIYRLLVPCIREAKRRRQVCIVTHNPNLAVVCDAEQIICASMDKVASNRITYLSGGIENPVINQRIVDVLEGTRPAFDNRSAKYSVSAAGA